MNVHMTTQMNIHLDKLETFGETKNTFPYNYDHFNAHIPLNILTLRAHLAIFSTVLSRCLSPSTHSFIPSVLIFLEMINTKYIFYNIYVMRCS
jgi:hypothetical protein